MIDLDSRIYELFISPQEETGDEYELFRTKLNSSLDFKWKAHGNDGEVEKKIGSADVIIILSGVYTNNKRLVQSHIDVARQLGKPIIVVRPYGLENVPSELEKIADEIVGWNAPCIIDAIREASGENNEY